jgi:thiosulfate reductase cytochrome b subunit
VETAALIDLPLPFVHKLQNGWGRSLHFLSVWVCVVNSFFYMASGLVSGHFRMNLLPGRSDLSWGSFTVVLSELRKGERDAVADYSYNVH